MRWTLAPLVLITLLTLSVLFLVDDVSAYSYDDVTDVLRISSDVEDSEIGDSMPWDIHSDTALGIVVEEGVSNIGDYAFDGFTTVVDISLPSSLDSLGMYAFSDCRALSALTVASDGLVVGNGAFHNAGSLSFGVDVEFVDGVTTVNRMFDGSERIGSVDLGDVTVLGDKALYGLGNTDIEIPEGIVSIGELALYGCTGLTELYLGEDLVHLGDDAFYGCSELTKVMFTAESCSDLSAGGAFRDIGDDVEFTIGSPCSYIPSNLFAGMDLSSLTISDSVTSIGAHAFHGFNGPEVVLPDMLEYIGAEAFLDCGSLRTLILSESIVDIGRSAFDGCTGLESIEFSAELDDLATGDVFFRNTGASDVTVRMMDVSHIPANLFLGFTGLSEVVLDDSVTEIGESAFAFCTSLGSIDLTTVTSVGKRAFYFCDSLSDVKVSDSVTIGDEAFRGCGLESVALDDVVLGEAVFSDCRLDSLQFLGPVRCISGSLSGLYDVTITFRDGSIVLDPEDTISDSGGLALRFECDSIPDGLLKSCSADISVIITSGVIGDEAFRNCINLDSVTFTDSVEWIGDHAFDGCTSIETITIPSYVNHIGDSAFSGLTSLESLTYHATNVLIRGGEEPFTGSGKVDGFELMVHGDVPDRLFSGTPSPLVGPIDLIGTVSIGRYSFRGSTVDSIQIPNSVQHIGEYAFSGTSITSVSLNGAIASVGTFLDCTSLEYANISNMDAIPDRLFQGCTSLQRVTFSKTLGSIGVGSFVSTSLASIQFPYTLDHVGVEAFMDCGSLEHVTFLGPDVSIDDRAFNGCPLEVIEMQNGTTYGEDAFTPEGDVRILLVGCPYGTMIDGFIAYPGQGYSGHVVSYDLGMLNLEPISVFADTLVDTSLIPSNGSTFTGWIYEDGSRYLSGTDPGEVTLYGIWAGVEPNPSQEPIIDPGILDVIAVVCMLVAVVCMVLANLPKRAS